MTMTLANQQLTLPEGVDMPLTPDQVATKSFPSVLRGYAKWEVDEFLKDVALDYQRALGLAEWAMQRSVTAHTETLGGPMSVDSSLDGPSTKDVVHLGAPMGPEAQKQIDRLGEHIRYLAILVNSMSQRIDHLESQVSAGSASSRLSAVPDPARRLTEVTSSTVGSIATPTAVPQPSPSDWWPSESPLWVVNGGRANGTTPNNYGPRA